MSVVYSGSVGLGLLLSMGNLLERLGKQFIKIIAPNLPKKKWSSQSKDPLLKLSSELDSTESPIRENDAGHRH